MWREVVVLGIEAERDGLALDRLVEPSHLRSPVTDPDPDDADVVEGGKDAQSTVFGLEGIDAGILDRGLEGGFEFGKTVLGNVAEKLHGDVALSGSGESEAVEPVLYGGHLAREVVGKVDTDEQAHRNVFVTGRLIGMG